MSPIRICGAETGAGRHEIRDWIERRRVAVVQPNISRSGGFTEIRRIAEMAEMASIQVIPHGWKTGITSGGISRPHARPPPTSSMFRRRCSTAC